MKKITVETTCELCGKGVIQGRMAQAPDGYVCEECVMTMAESGTVEIDARDRCFASSVEIN